MGHESDIVPEGMTPGEFAVQYIREHPMHFVRLIPKKLGALFLPWGELPSPTDWEIIEKLPDQLSASEVQRLKTKEDVPPDRLAFLLDCLEQDASLQQYSLREDLSDAEKSRFVYYLLMAGVHDFPTPRFYVPLRFIYKYFRYLLVCVLLVTLSAMALWPTCRKAVFRNEWLLACVFVCAAQLSVFLIFAGDGRYSMPVIPLLLIFTAVFVDLLLSWKSVAQATSL